MSDLNKKVVTRFAPSPTGFLHLGAYRTAIYAYLFAKKNNGTFVLRIEDTDKERNKQEFEDDILKSLGWLDLKYDVFYRQSEHVATHKKYLEKMIADGHAYVSKEEAKDGSGVIKEIIRFKNPNIDVTFHDEIKGDVTMNTTDLGDFVIAKNLEEPLFHLAVVVDDFEAGITHVIRGEDHTSNTPRQILIQRAIGAPMPIYAHLPLVLGPDKLKLSKRRGALPISAYKDQGFLPEAILNGVAFVGWNPGTDQEIFSHDELVSTFDLSKVQKSPAVFNEVKLAWFNKEHMKKLSKKEFWDYAQRYSFGHVADTEEDREMLEKLEPIIRDRIEKFSDIETMFTSRELDYFFVKPEYKKEQLLWKGSVSSEKTKECLKKVVEILDSLDSFNKASVHDAVFPYADREGRGEVLWPMRVALSGREKSPDPFTLAEILGKDETLARLRVAIAML